MLLETINRSGLSPDSLKHARVDRMSLIARDLAAIWHPCSQMSDYQDFPPLPVSSAAGCRLRLADGREVLDAISSWWCKSLGHGHPAVMAAIHPSPGERVGTMVALRSALISYLPQNFAGAEALREFLAARWDSAREDRLREAAVEKASALLEDDEAAVEKASALREDDQPRRAAVTAPMPERVEATPVEVPRPTPVEVPRPTFVEVPRPTLVEVLRSTPVEVPRPQAWPWILGPVVLAGVGTLVAWWVKGGDADAQRRPGVTVTAPSAGTAADPSPPPSMAATATTAEAISQSLAPVPAPPAPAPVLPRAPKPARSASELLDDAQEAFRVGATEQAISLARRAARTGGGARARVMLGRMLVRENRMAEAETEFATAVRMEPNNQEAAEWLARIRADRNKK